MVAAETDCNGIVPIALLILLIFLKLNQNLKFKPMEQYNLKNSNFRQLANSILETFWSIGTSIAASTALQKFKNGLRFVFFLILSISFSQNLFSVNL